MKHPTTLILLLLSLAQPGFAQVRLGTLEETVALAARQNAGIQAAAISRELAQTDIRIAGGNLLPNERFLLPCSDLGAQEIATYLDEQGFNWQDAIMYKTVSSDLSDLSDVTYDVLVFFSPLEIKSLYDNFPDFLQNDTRIAVYGNSTSKAVEERGLTINIKAPVPDVPSMTTALELYLQKSNKEV